MAGLSTHILDTSAGGPAAGVLIELFSTGDTTPLASCHTNADGRTDQPLIPAGQLKAQSYELHFHAGDYFRQRDGTTTAVPFLDVVIIRFGVGKDEGLFAREMVDEFVVPVMTPDMATRYPRPEDLAKATLIVDNSIDFLTPKPNWDAWFRAMDMDLTPTYGPAFSQADHALDAALAGVGVALGRRALVIKDIADGRLVAPYPFALPVTGRFRFLCPEGSETRPQVMALLDWMLGEVAKTAHVAEAMTMLEPK
jgi:5-hydroxyisourate hydrolase-like protein (transthyretin family)